MGICVTKNVCVAELLEDGYFNGHEGKQSGNYNIDDEKTVVNYIYYIHFI